MTFRERERETRETLCAFHFMFYRSTIFPNDVRNIIDSIDKSIAIVTGLRRLTHRIDAASSKSKIVINAKVPRSLRITIGALQKRVSSRFTSKPRRDLNALASSSRVALPLPLSLARKPGLAGAEQAKGGEHQARQGATASDKPDFARVTAFRRACASPLRSAQSLERAAAGGGDKNSLRRRRTTAFSGGYPATLTFPPSATALFAVHRSRVHSDQPRRVTRIRRWPRSGHKNRAAQHTRDIRLFRRRRVGGEVGEKKIVAQYARKLAREPGRASTNTRGQWRVVGEFSLK